MDFLPAMGDRKKVMPHSLLFFHVPPDKLHQGMDRSGKGFPGDPGDRIVNAAVSAGVTQIMSGHVNIFETEWKKALGKQVLLVTAGGGGEKLYEKDYPLNWMRMELTADSSKLSCSSTAASTSSAAMDAAFLSACSLA